MKPPSQSLAQAHPQISGTSAIVDNQDRRVGEFLRDNAEYYRIATNADAGYGGVLSHNPAPQLKGHGLRTQWGKPLPYSLDELAEVIPLNWQAPRKPATAIGRNVTLFESGMKWAGREANAEIEVLAALHAINQSFDTPLPENEIASTANQRNAQPTESNCSRRSTEQDAGNSRKTSTRH